MNDGPQQEAAQDCLTVTPQAGTLPRHQSDVSQAHPDAIAGMSCAIAPWTWTAPNPATEGET